MEFVKNFGAGEEISFIDHNGFALPKTVVERMSCGGLVEQLESCITLPARDSDVYVMTYPKAGTHWIWEIVTMLINNTSQYAKESKEKTMIEFLSHEEAEAVPSPRVINTHFPAKYVPQDALKRRCPIIHMMRNPKDVSVSLYHHCKTMPHFNMTQPFSVFLSVMLGENGFYMPYNLCKYELEWEQFSKDNPDYPILHLYYEDFKEDLEKWVREVARFLRVDATDDLIKQITENNELANLRKGYKEARPHCITHRYVVDGQPLMYRKGMVGDWKNWFTVADNEKMDAWLEQNFTNTNFKFRYTL